MVFDKMAAICRNFRLKIPFEIQAICKQSLLIHLKSGRVQILDPHCILEATQIPDWLSDISLIVVFFPTVRAYIKTSFHINLN